MTLPGQGSITISAGEAVAAAPDDKAAEQAARAFLDLAAASGAVSMCPAQAPATIEFRTDPAVKGGPEAYRLAIGSDRITVTASGAAGLYYGGISLWQLLTAEPGSGPVTLAAQTIEDAPRFGWRGFMLDSARHYQSPETIRHFIDWMALHKLNVFQWHLTDDQAWRIEIKRYPRLTEIGGWRVPAGGAAAVAAKKIGGIYTQDQIREIVAYAQARHIAVVPEIDVPGHATALIAAYPELGVAPGSIAAPSGDWGGFPNLINVEEGTFTFLDNVLLEVMDLFPGRYIHMGGDEAVKEQWQASPEVQARMKALGVKDEEALQGYVTRRMEKFLEAHGRRLIGWDEILDGGVSPHATIMSWRGTEGAVKAAKFGHDTILSPAPTLYLDNRQGGSPFEPPGRGEIVTVKDIFSYEPMPAELSAAERRHVLGSQANVWTEHIRSPENLTRMVFPRLAALAEIAWSPASGKDWTDFSSRLDIQRQRYKRIGLADDRIEATPKPGRFYSQQLRQCAQDFPLNLEGQAPIDGPRPIFLVEITNPCWILPAAEIGPHTRLLADVGQLPFNFQIGKLKDAIPLPPPHSKDGELEVRADSCQGAPIAVLPLAPAAGRFETTTLETPLSAPAGRHDLCFTFTRAGIDPFWAVNWIEIEERP